MERDHYTFQHRRRLRTQVDHGRRDCRSLAAASLLACCFLCSLCLVQGKAPSLTKKSVNTRNPLSSSSKPLYDEAPMKNETSSSSAVVVQLVETEVYDGRLWKAPGGSSRSTSFRWTDVDGEIAPSPDQWKGYDWTSEWKIVTSSQRDEFGWEYEFKTRMPIRRRIWLRSYEPSTATRMRRKQQKGAKKRGTLRNAVQLVVDDFNFKGFGFTFYKSLVFLKSFGVAFRIPLVTNFNTWESHPSMPSIASSVAYYTPATFVIFLNASVRYEWLKWILTNSTSTVVYVMAWLIWTLLVRGLIATFSALLFPLTRSLWLNPHLPISAPDWKIPPAFSRVIEERLGCSWSWRVSLERGYEYRVSYWHYFAPTVVGLFRGWKGVPSFLVRHAAALGLSTSGPIPDEPYMTSAALFAMSGFYFSSGKNQAATPVSMTSLEEMTSGESQEKVAVPVKEVADKNERPLHASNRTLAATNAADLLRL